MDSETHYIRALIELHQGLARQGPGDADFARQVLATLPPLPESPRLADLGCGSGAGTLLLAEYYQSPVLAVDLCPEFLADLRDRAQQAGVSSLITPLCADMGQLDWPIASVDLLWSEGAAYNLGFEVALQTWRPLLSSQGVAVISELSWFTESPPEAAIAYWQQAYPTMGTETDNQKSALRSGFTVQSTHRLPPEAWWRNYYIPLRERIGEWRQNPNTAWTPMRQSVVAETETEMELFQAFSQAYGYTFYVLQVKESAENP